MIYLFLLILAGIAWTVWFVLQWPVWVPAICTAVLAVVAIVLFVYRLLQASRSANALERAIVDQGRQQLMNARPERRAEIQSLQKQIQDGIGALKKSKLGGKRRGASALYALPWYAIIGPPGAGKTTALRHSGLVFPYADTAIRGVGGTRNCDWWFTNEAILLDTAGRYATEHQDQDEWLAFLDLLRKYRSHRPLNGLIIAVAINEIIDAQDHQIEQLAKRLRRRVDEVINKLGMKLPVYLVMTKCDLIGGFVEFFGDLRKSERAQPWGATIALKADKRDPGTLFSGEFDQLVKRAHGRALARMTTERDRKAREAILQFPLELAGLKRNVQDLISQVFMDNAYQHTPLFRGFYFTSGTQEGLPLNRVLQRMGQAMGLPAPPPTNQRQVEPKSYFLHDVFAKIVFPDANVAARSESAIRKQKLTRLAVGLSSVGLAFALLIPSIVSFFGNRELLDKSAVAATKAATIEWNDSSSLNKKLGELEPLATQLQELDEHRADGPPLSMRFWMYSGKRVRGPLVHLFVANMQQGFVQPCKRYLEGRLNKIDGKNYFEERELLKTYLMLSDVEHLDIEWALGKYLHIWADIQESKSDVDKASLKKKMLPMVRYYLELIKPDGEGKVRARPVSSNTKIVKRARSVLAKVPVSTRYYSLFVDSLNYSLYDPSGDIAYSNLQFPPVMLNRLFDGRGEVLKVLTSRQFLADKKYFQVDGPFTELGHYQVLANLKQAKKLLESEAWVMPLTKDESGAQIAVNLKRLATTYEANYTAAWTGFLEDLYIVPPETLPDAVKLYKMLGEQEWPYRRILRAVSDHTQWPRSGGALANEKLSKLANRRASQMAARRMKGIRIKVDVKKIAGRASTVPGTFRDIVRFAIENDGGKRAKGNTGLKQYIELLGKTRAGILDITDARPDASVRAALSGLQTSVTKTEALLQPTDVLCRRVMTPLLQLPLYVGRQPRINAIVLTKMPKP